jgi:hypothetical protein
LRIFFDGKPATLEVRRDSLEGGIANHEPLRIGRRDSGLGFYGLIDEVRIVPFALDLRNGARLVLGRAHPRHHRNTGGKASGA